MTSTPFHWRNGFHLTDPDEIFAIRPFLNNDDRYSLNIYLKNIPASSIELNFQDYKHFQDFYNDLMNWLEPNRPDYRL